MRASFGARFWGQVRGSSGRLRVLQGKGGTSEEISQIAGKAHHQAPFPDHLASGRIHGKEGSTVRVRQRASDYLLLSASFRCLVGRDSRSPVSTERPRTSSAPKLSALSVSSSRIACSRPSRARWP